MALTRFNKKLQKLQLTVGCICSGGLKVETLTDYKTIYKPQMLNLKIKPPLHIHLVIHSTVY